MNEILHFPGLPDFGSDELPPFHPGELLRDLVLGKQRHGSSGLSVHGFMATAGAVSPSLWRDELPLDAVEQFQHGPGGCPGCLDTGAPLFRVERIGRAHVCTPATFLYLA